jgi:hypothetical protein
MPAFDNFIAEWTKLTLAAHARNVRYIYVDDEDIVDDVSAWITQAYDDELNAITDEDELIMLDRMCADEEQEEFGTWISSRSEFEDVQ